MYVCKTHITYYTGLAITRPTYAGEISKIDKTFLAVLDRYVRSIFEQEIQAKTINGHLINAADLLTFFDVYSTCFERVMAVIVLVVVVVVVAYMLVVEVVILMVVV